MIVHTELLMILLYLHKKSPSDTSKFPPNYALEWILNYYYFFTINCTSLRLDKIFKPFYAKTSDDKS